MSLELKLENTGQSALEWLLVTQMQFYMRNLEPRLFGCKLYRRATEKTTASKGAGVPYKCPSLPLS